MSYGIIADRPSRTTVYASGIIIEAAVHRQKALGYRSLSLYLTALMRMDIAGGTHADHLKLDGIQDARVSRDLESVKVYAKQVARGAQA